jgi:uncharacterized protein (TIGR01777 family)
MTFDVRMARVLVSGVSGPIGAALLPTLRSAGAVVVRLARPESKLAIEAEDHVAWKPEKEIAPESVSGFDAVVHLAGESIAGRWTDEKKKRIRESRVMGTGHLAQAIARAREKPRVFICSSAIGFYGDRGDEVLNEASPPGTGFLPEVCRAWEDATRPASEAGIRTVCLRTGIVLSPSGGALGQMLTPFKLGLGGRIGDGRQWMSWIDVQDMVGGIHHILKTDGLQGAVNMVAPRPVRNAEFTRTLAGVLSRPAIFPVPAVIVKTVFGEMGATLLLGSQRAEPGELVASGYPFRFSDLRASLENTLRR